jgi:tRNA threonylcarbamoyladenosine biosynthesis protein TsaB
VSLSILALPILALDAAGAACSAALWRDGAIAAHRRRPMQRGHAEALMPLLLEVLAAAGTGFADLGRIAVGVGPGSFTGIRIALAAARGIGLAAKLPVVGVDSFSAVAAALPLPPRPGEALLVVIDSRREALFGQYYDDTLTPLGEPHVLNPDALLARRPAGPLLIAGDGASLLPAAAAARIAEGEQAVDATAIARLAAAGGALRQPRPLYLRPPDVTLPEQGGGQ